uniref:Uncharacterized protein n=1 Tax=Rhizoctonia solani TaxID=456999 RepID=N0ABY5_9AGAM|nr:hypothetical protein RSOL_m01350 [Rhizoctonia solani]AGK45446.1 hypothetical protein RSOL_m01350 [Rhizoctonia solani]
MLSISQLKFDKYILVSIANQLGVGTVYEYPTRAAAELVVVGLSKIQHPRQQLQRLVGASFFISRCEIKKGRAFLRSQRGSILCAL